MADSEFPNSNSLVAYHLGRLWAKLSRYKRWTDKLNATADDTLPKSIGPTLLNVMEGAGLSVVAVAPLNPLPTLTEQQLVVPSMETEPALSAIIQYYQTSAARYESQAKASQEHSSQLILLEDRVRELKDNARSFVNSRSIPIRPTASVSILATASGEADDQDLSNLLLPQQLNRLAIRQTKDAISAAIEQRSNDIKNIVTKLQRCLDAASQWHEVNLTNRTDRSLFELGLELELLSGPELQEQLKTKPTEIQQTLTRSASKANRILATIQSQTRLQNLLEISTHQSSYDYFFLELSRVDSAINELLYVLPTGKPHVPNLQERAMRLFGIDYSAFKNEQDPLRKIASVQNSSLTLAGEPLSIQGQASFILACLVVNADRRQSKEDLEGFATDLGQDFPADSAFLSVISRLRSILKQNVGLKLDKKVPGLNPIPSRMLNRQACYQLDIEGIEKIIAGSPTTPAR